MKTDDIIKLIELLQEYLSGKVIQRFSDIDEEWIDDPYPIFSPPKNYRVKP